MISMTCACKGEFWVRDRLAETLTPCPSCGSSLAVPSLESVRERMAPATCSCGEIFWSSAWQPGKLTRCPICGDIVGPSKSEGETTVILSTGSADIPGPLAQPGARGDSERTTAATTMREKPSPAGLMGRRRGLALAGVGALLLAVGLALESQLAGTPDEGGSDPTPVPSGAEREEVSGRDDEPPRLPIDRGPSAHLKILVPAYFYPGGSGLDDWKRLIASAGRVPIVAVVNPQSGPGDAPNRDYTDIIRGGTATAGLTMIGYVNTAFATRPRPEIEADIDRWARFYPEIQGIFLDAQSSKVEDVVLYKELREYAIRALGDALVVTNPGTLCVEDYFEKEATDLAVVFENARGFEEFDLPLWRLRYPPERFAALPHGVPSADAMEEMVRQAGAKGIGSIFVTDGEMPNHWDGLPPYWAEMVDAVEEINAGPPTTGL